MDDKELEQENNRLKRLVRFMYLTLGFYATEWNYKEGNTSYSGVMFDGGREANEAIELMDFLGFNKQIVGNTFPGPHSCTNCEGNLKYENIYPCRCDKPEIDGLDKKSYRKW